LWSCVEGRGGAEGGRAAWRVGAGGDCVARRGPAAVRARAAGCVWSGRGVGDGVGVHAQAYKKKGDSEQEEMRTEMSDGYVAAGGVHAGGADAWEGLGGCLGG
jgi:hypothetical protein